jgi:hypothetical protein
MHERRQRLVAGLAFAFFAATALFSAMEGCGSSVAQAVTDAGATDSGLATQVDTLVALRDGEVDTSWTLDTMSDPPPDGATDPVVSCGADAASEVLDADGAVDICPLPPSRCLDRSWLLSYVSGVCVDGKCTYVHVFHDCSPDSQCVIDRCVFLVGK